MKAKKALKRLHQVDAILAAIIDRYDGSQPGVKELLATAQAAVARAEATVASGPGSSAGSSSATARRTGAKQAAQTQKTKPGGLTAAGRKRLSLAAKKRWAAARRKGVHAMTGRPLTQTA